MFIFKFAILSGFYRKCKKKLQAEIAFLMESIAKYNYPESRYIRG